MGPSDLAGSIHDPLRPRHDDARNTAGRVDLARWSVRVGGSLVVLAGTALVVFGLVLVAEDQSQQGEMFDGLGTFLGLAICGLGLVCVAVAGLVLWLAVRRTRAAGVVLCLLGVLVAAAGWGTISSAGAAVGQAMILGGLVVAGLGFAGALGTSPRAIDSPGGGYSR